MIDLLPRVLAFGKSRTATTLDFCELKHETQPDSPGVSYAAYLDCPLLDLSSGAMRELEEGPGQGDPQVIKLLVQIGDVNAHRAGPYSDVRTLHFTAY